MNNAKENKQTKNTTQEVQGTRWRDICSTCSWERESSTSLGKSNVTQQRTALNTTQWIHTACQFAHSILCRAANYFSLCEVPYNGKVSLFCSDPLWCWDWFQIFCLIVLTSLCSFVWFIYPLKRDDRYARSSGTAYNLPDFEASLNPVVLQENSKWIHLYDSLERLEVLAAFMNGMAMAIWFNLHHFKVLYCIQKNMESWKSCNAYIKSYRTSDAHLQMESWSVEISRFK